MKYRNVGKAGIKVSEIALGSWMTDLKESSEEDVTKTDTADIEQSLVRIAVKQSAGMGIIWAVTEDNVVIASNRHVLTGDVEAQVTFADGEQLTRIPEKRSGDLKQGLFPDRRWRE